MVQRAVQRTFRTDSLGSWLERLVVAWEEQFSAEALTQGRKLYRGRAVTGLTLEGDSVVVYTKIERQECYSVLDWEVGGWSVRTSVQDRAFGEALAVAGLYELEELIAEEGPLLPAERNWKKTVALDEEREEVKEPAKTVPARSLRLAFSVTASGLYMRAFWVDGDVLKPALDPDDAGLTLKEREQLILLSTYAHRAGFIYEAAQRAYLLKEIGKILEFLNKTSQLWRKLFELKWDEAVERLRKGVQAVRVRAHAQTDDSGDIRFNWELVLGEEVLSDAMKRRLLSRRGEAVLVPGAGVLYLPEEKGDALAEWNEQVSLWREGSVPRYMLFSLFEKTEVDWSCDQSLEAWRKRVLGTLDKKCPVPSFLRPYQKEGVAWLAQRLECDCHPLLADEMGLGKTLQVLSLINARSVANKPSLIVCPASVVPVWEQEAAHFFPGLKVCTVRSGYHFANQSDPAIWLCSYTQLRRHKALLNEVDFGYAVLDEAQFIKNPDTKVAHACLNIRAEHRLALSGTPLENKHLDLWTVFRFLMPGLLGSRRHFEARVQSEGENFIRLLKRQIAPFVLRRTKAAVLEELPEKIESILPCSLTDLQQGEYVRIVNEAKAALNDRIGGHKGNESLNLFTWLLRLRQAACDPALLPGMGETHWSQSGKISALIDRLQAIFDSEKKVVIFSQFVAFLNNVTGALKARYPEVPRFRLTGDTKNRAEPVDGFQKAKGAGVILVSLRAGGTGITLHAADYVFLLDPWWNPAVESQAVDRVHRMGQKNGVMVYRMIAPGTLEERIQLLKARKSALFESVVGDLPPTSELDHYFASLGALVDYTK